MLLKFSPFLFFLLFFPLAVSGKIIFSDPDLSGDNRLLFRAAAGMGSDQDALFIARLAGAGEGTAMRQLTAYPEKIDLLENGRILQIRSAFGAVRVPVSGGLPAPVSFLPSFAGGSAGVVDRAEEMAPSADGRWFLYIDPASPALGNLMLLDAASGGKLLVASGVERPEKVFPAAWSRDSRFFVYEREGKLYYFMPGTSAALKNENSRLIGEGKINSIFWGRGGDFFYLRGSTLYQVRGSELFTRAVYSDFLDIGAVAGKIPLEFDPSFDSFWIAPEGSSMLVSKGRRFLFFFPLPGTNAETSGTSLPGLLLPRSCSAVTVLWPAGGTAAVFVSLPGRAGTDAQFWRLELSEGGAVFKSLPRPLPAAGAGSFPNGSASPDGSMALLWGSGGILLYDYANWKPLAVLSSRPGLACLWTGNDECITGDDQKIERIRLSAAPPAAAASTPGAAVSGRETLCLSRASQAGFEEGSFRILARSGNAWFATDGKNPWVKAENPALVPASQASSQYRVYLENQSSGIFENLPMVRNLLSAGTVPLFPLSAPQSAGTTGAGPAAKPMKAALCFDLYDDDRGVPEVLDALNRFGFKATFFLNGEFIRRHPEAVQEIAAEGHEAASMFFAPVDLSDTRYQAGADFISRGLARNEDEFFGVTGKELALLWHPPWYMASPAITAAAAEAGYATVFRTIDPLDWIGRDDEKKLGIPRPSSSAMIESIVDSIRPGSVVPLRLGLLAGGRSDYLFNRINVLIQALVREGYTLVPVSKLTEKQAY